MKIIRRITALFSSMALLCFLCLPVWAAGFDTMDPIDWDGYIADPNYVVEGNGDDVDLDKDTSAAQLSVTSYLYKLGEENYTCAQMMRATAELPDAYWEILSAGRQNHSTFTRYAKDEELETSSFEASVGEASGDFGDFQGEDTDSIPSVHWELAYYLDVYLISEAWYPSALFYETGVLPATYTSTPMTREEALETRAQREEQGEEFQQITFNDKPCVLQTNRTEEINHFPLDVYDYGDSISLGTPGSSDSGSTTTLSCTSTERWVTLHYYVIDTLPQCPGVYSVVDLKIRDNYRDQQSNAKKIFPQARDCISEYETLSSTLYARLGELGNVELKDISWIGQGNFSGLAAPAEQFTPIEQNEVITDPPDKPGEFQGDSPIDKVIVTGVGGVIAALGGAAAKKGKKKKDGDDEEEEETVLRMLLNKNFGNQLKKGEAPRAVYARIVEIKKSGEQIERHDLTARIEVLSPDESLIVSDGGITNSYKAAMVSVPENSTDAEGVVMFRLTGPGGVFTQSVVFMLTEAQIIFAQENMGLPANRLKFAQEDGENSKFGDGIFRLPFLVKDMGEAGKSPLQELRVTARLEKDRVTNVNGDVVAADPKYGMPYSVEVVPDEEHKDKGLYEARIREVLDYELPAGTTEGIIMTVTAELGTPGTENYEKLEGKFPIFRIHLGLALTLQESSVGCYMQLRPERKGIKKEWVKPSDLEPCFTDGSVILFLYQKKDLSIIRIPVVPEQEVKVMAKRLEQDRYCHIGDAEESHQALADSLGISVFPTDRLCENGARQIKVSTTKAALDPPTRMLVDLEFTVKHKSRTFTIRKENILLRSQPFRVAETTEESLRQIKNDKDITDKLERIKSLVYARHMDHLASLYNLVDRMLDGYDSRFGYDKNQLEKVKKIWVGYAEGTFAGANADAEPVTLADELEACYAFMQGLRDNTGFLGRVAMGVMTAGYSEYVFTTMTIAEEMREAVFNCTGDKDFGFWDGVIMGVKEFEKQILMEVAIGGINVGRVKIDGIARQTNLYIAKNTGFDIGLQLTKLGRKYTATMLKADRWMNRNVAAYKWANTGFKGAKNFYNSSARSLKNAIDDMKQSLDDALSRGKTKVNNAKLTPEAIKAQEEYLDAMSDGMEKVRRLQKAQQEMERITDFDEFAKAKARYREAANEVWKDKNALKQLQINKSAYSQRMRAQFNNYREPLLDEVQLEARADLARGRSVPPEQLYVMNASNGVKTEYANGTKVPGDRDITIKQKVLSDRSKDVTINQSEGERAVARRLFRKLNGRDADTIEEALDFMKEMDVSYVHPEGDSAMRVFEHNLEGYEDLPGMVGIKSDGTMDKSMLKKDLHNLAVNRAAVAHKGKEWFLRSEKSLKAAADLEAEAASLTGAARESALAKARQLRHFAQGQTVEGIRQLTKQTEKIIIPRRAAWYSRGKLPPEATELHQIAKLVDTECVAPAVFEHILKTDYGMTLYQYADYVGGLLI